MSSSDKGGRELSTLGDKTLRDMLVNCMGNRLALGSSHSAVCMGLGSDLGRGFQQHT